MIRPSLILLGLIIGVGLGLLYGWVISPVQYTNTDPSSFAVEYKEQYIGLVAAAYKADGDLDRARLRLLKLKDEALLQTITALAQRTAAEGKDASGLAVLAADLAGGPPSVAAATATPAATPEPVPPTDTVAAPGASPTAIALFPTPSPTATPDFDYALIIREPYCDDEQRLPLIIVDVIDASGLPLPGVRVTVQWGDGQDGFVTGLKPEISPSYGDFLMEVGTTYSVQVGARTPAVGGLSAPSCTSQVSNVQYAGAIRLVFQRK